MKCSPLPTVTTQLICSIGLSFSHSSMSEHKPLWSSRFDYLCTTAVNVNVHVQDITSNIKACRQQTWKHVPVQRFTPFCLFRLDLQQSFSELCHYSRLLQQMVACSVVIPEASLHLDTNAKVLKKSDHTATILSR